MAHERGRLDVIRGCMFAGKTAELIRRLRAAEAAGRRAVALKPAQDDRYAADELVTHDGQRYPARCMARATQLTQLAREFDIVGIDEAHFFDEVLVNMCLALVDLTKQVIVSGVFLDHRGRPFDTIEQLSRYADGVTELTAPCSVCGRPAIHSQRNTPTDDRIVVGGADAYEPRCESCFSP